MTDTRPDPWEMADAAFRKAAANVVRLARQTGTPVLIVINGELRPVSPDELAEYEEGNPSPQPAPGI